jgi:hypothetical protein
MLLWGVSDASRPALAFVVLLIKIPFIALKAGFNRA